jgi:hypothetical protein
MESRVLFYTGIPPETMTDDELIKNHERIMFALKERGEAK